MRAIRIALVTVLLCGAVTYGYAQDPDKKGSSILGSNAEGTYFIVGFMQNEARDDWNICPRGVSTRIISIASRFNTTVTIQFPDGVLFQKDLVPFEVYSVYPNSGVYECFGEGVFNRRSFEIKSTRAVSVYCYSSRQTTSDGYLALPVSSWGKEYVTANYYLDHYSYDIDDQQQCNLIPRSGEFAIIAAEDNTVVSVYPKTLTKLGGQANQQMQTTLMKGEIWQVQDGNNIRGNSDLTGSLILADKPVGLLSGHVRTAIPYTLDTKDHLIEMLPPASAYGKTHIAVPFGGRQGGDLVRIISANLSPINVTMSDGFGTTSALLAGIGDFSEINIDRVTVITSDEPVLVSQYSRSALADPRNRDSITVNFDPYMVVVTPEEQFVNSAIFQTIANGNQFTGHYVTIVAEKANFNTLTMNSIPLTAYSGFTQGPVPGLEGRYVWATIPLAGGSAYAITGEALFGGYVYGVGFFDSYGWPVGAGLRDPNYKETIPPDIAAERVCGGAAFDIVVTDSTEEDNGLRDVRLDTANSSNVTLNMGAIATFASEAYGTVTLIDATKAGVAVIVAEDVDGNLDTLVLNLQESPVLVTPNPVVLNNVQPNSLIRDVVRITNPAPELIQIDSARLRSGVAFKLDRAYEREYIAGNGGWLDVEYSFREGARATYRDTMDLYVNCQHYIIPMVVYMPVPGIATEDRDYGKLRVGKKRCLEVPIRNTGSGSVRIDTIIVNGKGFNIESLGLALPLVLEKGMDTIITICFTPDATEDFSGEVQFISSDADTIVVANVRGRGIYPLITLGGYDFGKLQVGDTKQATIAIRNIGTDTAFLTGIANPRPDIFIINQSIFPHALPADSLLWVSVEFAPDADQAYRASIQALNSDGLEADSVLLGNAYVLSAEITGYDWGRRWINTQYDTVVYVRNLGNEPITISRVWIADGDEGDFNIINPVPVTTLGVGEEMEINVRFTPMLQGYRSVIIHAETTSRQPQYKFIINTLEGFGIEALAGHELDFSGLPAYSCGTRMGRLVIHNNGNAPLTLQNIWATASPNLVTFNLPSAGYVIPVNSEPLTIDFTVDFAGYFGQLSGQISWTFDEIAGQPFSETFTLTSAQQLFTIAAATPPKVSINGKFDLVVNVQNSFWKGELYDQAIMEIEYNNTMTRFDLEEWEARALASTAMWRPRYTLVDAFPGRVVLAYDASGAGSLAALDGVTFAPIPFQGFLGNDFIDTFRVTMYAGDTVCVQPAYSAVMYEIDQICGLSERLFEYTGDLPVLKQNVPNPVTGRTEIGFTVAMESETRLELYTTDGDLVQTPMDKMLPAGDYSVTLDVSGLPSGLYYYRLTSGPFTFVKRMVVAK